jgi:DnaK suppressor protein
MVSIWPIGSVQFKRSAAAASESIVVADAVANSRLWPLTRTESSRSRGSPGPVRVYAWWMPPVRGLTDIERRQVRAAIVAELTRAEEQAASLSRQFEEIVGAAELSNTDDEHDPEGSTIAFERSQVSALLNQAGHDVAALQLTLTSVDDHDFGLCERCAGPIGFERLVALPATHRCVECAR